MAGSKITWDNHATMRPGRSNIIFCQIVHLVFDEFRNTLAKHGEQFVPTIFIGAPERKSYKVPSPNAIDVALRNYVKARRRV